MLVAFTVASLMMAGAMAIAMSSRSSYSADQHRTSVNQNLRSALDLIGIEVRQAGERLPFDFPALEIIDGGTGPDTLVLRRNRLDAVLPLCGALTAGGTDTEVRIADPGPSSPQGCLPLSDDDGSGFPDNLDGWRAMRSADGGKLDAYLFNPVSDVGEWLVIDGDGTTTDFVSKGNAEAWVGDYGLAQQCRLYALSELRYSLGADGVLEFQPNGDPDSTIHLSASVVDFQVRAILDDGSVLDDLGVGDEWTRLRAVDVTVTGQAVFEGRTLTRTASARFFPRNVLSN